MASHLIEGCVFCLIIQGTLPSLKLYEDEKILAFLDINPVSEGHTQIIPKYHARTLADLPDEYMIHILPLAKKIAKASGAPAYNILQNNGKLAFQHVDHVHFHVVPKTKESDGLVINIEDNWPQQKVGKEELQQVLEKMKSTLQEPPTFAI